MSSQNDVIPEPNITFAQNLTSDLIATAGTCNSLHYSLPIVSLLVFFVGLMLEPRVIHEMIKKMLSDRVNAGNFH